MWRPAHDGHDTADRVAAANGYLLYLRQEGRGIGLAAKFEERGITVVERRSTHAHVSPANRRYLAAKVAVGAHDLPGLTTDRHG